VAVRSKGVDLLPLSCWNCGFKSCRGHGSLSLVNVVFCQVEVSAPGRSLVQRSPTECVVSQYDREASIIGKPWPTRAPRAIEKCEVFYKLTLYTRIKSHLLFAGIIRSSPFSPR